MPVWMVTKIVDDYFGMALTSDYYGAENKNGNVNLKNIRGKSLIMQFLRILQRRVHYCDTQTC